jgi:hypothetical protein
LSAFVAKSKLVEFNSNISLFHLPFNSKQVEQEAIYCRQLSQHKLLALSLFTLAFALKLRSYALAGSFKIFSCLLTDFS